MALVRSNFSHTRVSPMSVQYLKSSNPTEGYAAKGFYLGTIQHFVVVFPSPTLRTMLLLKGEGMLMPYPNLKATLDLGVLY